MEKFYDIAKYLANSTRDFIQREGQPTGAGCILVHFEVLDKNFVKSYFGEECDRVSYPFPLIENGSMISDKMTKIDDYYHYFGGVAMRPTEAVAHTNYFGLCSLLVTTELYTDNSHSDVTTDGTPEASGFAEGYQYYKCATANVCCRITNKVLFKVVIAILSEHDHEIDNWNISKRTRESISSLSDYLSSLCGEYCTISINR